jgi:hypothetical protein
MSARIRRNFPLLLLLVNASPQQRQAILATATDDLITAISEIAKNTLKGRIPLTSYQITALKKKKAVVKKLCNKRIAVKTKRKLVAQSGGFIGSLIGITLPLLSGLLSSR